MNPKPCKPLNQPMPTTIVELPNVVGLGFEPSFVDSLLDALLAPWAPRSLLSIIPCEDAEEPLG